MDLPTNIASFIVSVVTGLAAYAAARSANKATVRNAEINSRTTMEEEAYDRARKFDTETIKRQDEELIEVREVNKKLSIEIAELQEANRKLAHVQSENENLKDEIKNLNKRIERLENGVPPETP